MRRKPSWAALEKAASERILIIDGAMGTMIQQYKLGENHYRGERFADHSKDIKGNNDLLVLTQPEIIEEIHSKYLRAHADIIETNTFNAQRISLADYHMEDLAYEINVEAAKLARSAADEWTKKTPDKPRFVAGAVGPTNRTASISPDVNNPGYRNVNFDELRDAYKEQVRGLIDGGSDIILIETIFDTLNAKAAGFATLEVFEEKDLELPVMISGTITDRSGRTLSGQTAEAFWYSMRHLRPFSIGLNCALGAELMRPYITELSHVADVRISAYPNAGLPNAMGDGRVRRKPARNGLQDRALVGRWPDQYRWRLLRLDARSHRAHRQPRQKLQAARTRENRAASPPFRPRTVRPRVKSEMTTANAAQSFINVGERTNVTGSAKFRKLIEQNDYGAALAVARQQVEAGAQIIDVNMDEGLLDSEKAMATFLNLIASEPDISRVPIMIDSSKWSVIEAGLKCVQGKPIVNSISMKEGEGPFLENARKVLRYGAAVVVMAFDEQGQADTVERKVSICERAYKLLTEKVGFPPEDHHLRSEHLRRRDRHRRAQRLRHRLHRGGASDQGKDAARPYLGRRVESVICVSWQRAGAGSHALGLPLPRHQGWHGHGHRQRRAVGALRRYPGRTARACRGRDPQTVAPTQLTGCLKRRRSSRATAAARRRKRKI